MVSSIAAAILDGTAAAVTGDISGDFGKDAECTGARERKVDGRRMPAAAAVVVAGTEPSTRLAT